MSRRLPLTTSAVVHELEQLYNPPRSFLNWSNPLELVIATVLSAQCTDDRVNQVTASLFAKYKKAEEYLSVPVEEMEQDIRPVGTYRVKARHIQGIAHMVLTEFGGMVPQTMEELIRLPGVGRKTATIVLYAAFDRCEGIAVDTHVLRLAQRLGLTKASDPLGVENDLLPAVPKSEWCRVNPLLISHGRAVCTALRRRCGACVFQDTCPSSLTRGLPDLAAKRERTHK